MYQIKTVLFITALFITTFHYVHANTVMKQNDTDTSIQQAILFHINEYRQRHGLAALQMNDKMVKEAKQHSQEMANHKIPFGHQEFQKRINKLHAKISNSGAGAENVAYNYKDAEDVVKNWLRSPGHKRNIDGNYNLTGIGIARNQNGAIYFTQIFLQTKARHYVAQLQHNCSKKFDSRIE